jgi:hypothetical protein
MAFVVLPRRRVISYRVTNRTYGTVSPEQQKGMTGLKFVQGLADGTSAW